MKAFFPVPEGLIWLRLVATCCLVGAPSIYVYIIRQINYPGDPSQAPTTLVASILVVVVVVQQFLFSVVERSAIKRMGTSTITQMTIDQVVSQLLVIRIVNPASVFTLGVILYFVSRNYTWLIVFYVAAAGLSVLAWPTQTRYERLKKRLEEARRP